MVKITCYGGVNEIGGNKILFEENKGQWRSKILFKAAVKDGALFLEKNCLTFNFVNPADMERVHWMHHHPEDYTQQEIDNTVIRYHAYKVRFLNSSDPLAFTPGNKQSFYSNFLPLSRTSFHFYDNRKYCRVIKKLNHLEIVFLPYFFCLQS